MFKVLPQRLVSVARYILAFLKFLFNVQTAQSLHLPFVQSVQFVSVSDLAHLASGKFSLPYAPVFGMCLYSSFESLNLV